MKLMLLSIFFLALSHSDYTRPAKGGTGSMELVLKTVETLKKNDKKVAVEFSVINKNPFPVYLHNPSCWGTVMPLIKYNDTSVSPSIKVRVDPACAKALGYVAANDTLKVKYNYTIDKFIDLGRTGNYRLQFKYRGTLLNEKKIKLEEITLISNEVSFEVQP